MGDRLPPWLKSVLKKPQTTIATVSQDVAAADNPTVEPSSLARRIHALIHKLPTPAPVDTPTQSDNDEQQILPSTSINDHELVHALSSPITMNGSLDGRPSVWSILEDMGSPRHESEMDLSSEAFSNSSSVMVYSPLLPAQNSLVELAESEVLIEEEEETDGPEPTSGPPPPIPGWSWANTLPTITSWFTQPSDPTPPPPLLNESDLPLTPRTRERRLRAQRAWVPSKEKLSIQCMWWGYRIFLPPPVLDILDDKQLEATRRAAMITTALTWFFNNLPINTLPLPLRPTLLLFQQIAPFLGSIGTFISWSWGVIKGYDQGLGVTLTATWLLPIALIPGTWFNRDWPVSPPPPENSPLPPDVVAESSPSFPLLPTPPQSNPGALPTPTHTPTPTFHQHELLPFLQSTPRPFTGETSFPLSPSPTIQSIPMSPRSPPGPLVEPGTPLVPSTLHTIHSPPLSHPVSPPNYPDSPAVSSPTMSFTTAPSSPVSSPNKRLRTSLAGLVAKSPMVRVRHSFKRRHSTSSPKTASSPLRSSSTPQQFIDPLPPIVQPSSPPPNPTITSSTPYLYYYYHQHLSPEHVHPSPPAHPDDVRLLQSPPWQCSPLPPEQYLHDST